MKKLIAILFLVAFAVAQIHPAMDAIQGCKHNVTAKAKSCCDTHHKQEKKNAQDDCCKDDCNPFTGNCGKCGIDAAVTTFTSLEVCETNWEINKVYPTDVTHLFDYASNLTQPPELS